MTYNFLNLSLKKPLLALFGLGLVACNQPAPKPTSEAMSETLPQESNSNQSQNIGGAQPPSVPSVPNDDGILSVSDIDFESYSIDLASFIGISIGESKSSVEDKIHAQFKPENGTEGEGHTEYSLTEVKAEGGSVVVATAEGLADDSVKAQQLYVIFKDDTLVTYGMKIKCWRGDRPNVWQKTYCP